MVHKILTGSVAGIAFLAMAGTANAVPISGFGDPNTNAALVGGTVIDFDSGPVGESNSVNIAGVTFNTGDGGTFEIGPDFIGSFNTRGVNSLFNEDFGTVVFDIFFGTPVDAVAFNFGASDDLWRLSAFDSGGNLLESIDINPITTSNAGDFFGIAADGIANVELFTVGGGQDFVFIDNFTFNTRRGTAVPEPGTLALFGIGLAGLALVRRRKAVKSLTI